MKLENHLQANCSDYVVQVSGMSDFTRSKIQELEKDLQAQHDWQDESKKNLPPEPDWLDHTDIGIDNWTEWFNLKEVKDWYKSLEARWETLKSKYTVDNETIFDTTLHGFHWSEDKSQVTIPGYLNEQNFLKWLEQIAKADKIICNGG
jgi:hypothetical protein